MTVPVGYQIAVRQMNSKDVPLLEGMYNSYIPLGGTLGLPPCDPVSRRVWLKKLSRGVNLVAYFDGALVGHLVLLSTGGAAEMVAYVHQDYRRHGTATAMTKAAIERARADGFSYIWLLIAKTNFAAQRGLQKFGFHVAWQDLHEMQFVYPLIT